MQGADYFSAQGTVSLFLLLREAGMTRAYECRPQGPAHPYSSPDSSIYHAFGTSHPPALGLGTPRKNSVQCLVWRTCLTTGGSVS